MTTKKRFLQVFVLTAGILTVGAAVLAREVGIDNDMGWGTKRLLLLLTGVLLSLVGLVWGHLLAWMDKNPVWQRIRENGTIQFSWKYGYITPVAGLVLIAYFWFAGSGSWTTWPERTNYYVLQARGFQKGELKIPVEPSEKLLALADPYDPSQRFGVAEPLDVSLYKGNFYLYWGPVPALLLVPIRTEVLRRLSDLHLVFGFSCGLFLVLACLVVVLWDRYFSSLPKWILILSVLVAGLAGPTLWTISSGYIYEAAIIGGQFFMAIGFLAALSALHGSIAPDAKLLLAGSFWALAIGTRLTLILPIGFMVLMVLWRLWKTGSAGFAGLLRKSIFLGGPMLLGLALLSWYNWARFGSFTETGITYQLAGTHIQKHMDGFFSPQFILQNIYNYLLAPIQFDHEFPFIYGNYGRVEPVLPFYDLPDFYNTNPVTGLLFLAPFVFFSLFHLKRRQVASTDGHEQPHAELSWILVTLSGAVLLAILFLLLFFWASMRYMTDFFPMLVVLSILGYFQAYGWARQRGRERRMAWIGVIVAVYSMGMSALLTISEYII
jgi:hypothetical protein